MPLLSNIVLQVYSVKFGKRKIIKGIQIEEKYSSVFVDKMTLENYKESL